MSTPVNETKEDCSTCRFHSEFLRNKPLPDALESMESMLVLIEDAPATVYVCQYLFTNTKQGSKEIGFDPIHCEHWESPPKKSNQEADSMIAAWEARQKNRKRDEER